MIQKGAWYGVWWVWVFWICGKPPIVNVKIWQFEAQTPAIFPFWGIALLHSDTRGLSCFLGGSKNRKDTKPISRHSTRARAVYAIILHCFNKLVWSKNHWKAMPNILSIIIHWNMSCVCVLTMCLFFRDHFLVNFSEAPIRGVRGVLRAGSGDVFHPKTSVNADKWCKSEAYRFCHWTAHGATVKNNTMRWPFPSMAGIVLLG